MSEQKQTPSVNHPLEQLTADEIELAVDIFEVESELSDEVQYHNVVLNEPPKSFVREFEIGDSFDREINIVAREEGKTYEATVSLTERELLSCEHVPGVEPAVMPEEIEAAREAVKNDEAWRKAAKKRGVENFDLVMVDPWSASGFEPEEHDDKRLCRAISWIRTGENDNGRARPIEGLFAFVTDSAATERAGEVPVPVELWCLRAKTIRILVVAGLTFVVGNACLKPFVLVCLSHHRQHRRFDQLSICCVDGDCIPASELDLTGARADIEWWDNLWEALFMRSDDVSAVRIEDDGGCRFEDRRFVVAAST